MALVKVHADMDGTVFELPRAPGDALVEGDAIVILESMKMEVVAGAPCAGRLERMLVAVGDTVTQGAVLAVIETA